MASVWQRPGVFLFALTSNAGVMNNLLDWAQAADFGWVALQCFNDTTLIEQSAIPTWRDAIRARAMTFGLWGVQHTDPSGDAGRASSQIGLWGADFYIANAEADYKVDSGGTRANAATFCTAFRAVQPSIPAALSTYGAIANDTDPLGLVTNAAAGVMDMKAWYDAGFDILPQAYASDGVQIPWRVAQQMRRCQWPYSRIHPTVGIYVGGTTYRGTDYRTMLGEVVNTEWEMDIKADSPKAFWKMEVGSGVPKDSSGNGLDMTSVTNTPDYLYDLPLDHVESIRCVGGEALNRSTQVSTVTDNFTIEMLVKVEAIGQSNQLLFYNGNSGANGWGIVVQTNLQFQALCGGVAFVPLSSGVLSASAYKYLVVTRDAGTWRYYLNGVIDAGGGGTTAPGTPSGTIKMGDVSVQFASSMVAVHERALTGTEIAARYALVAGNKVSRPESAYGFSLFLGESAGSLGAITQQDYIDLGLAALTDQAAFTRGVSSPVYLPKYPKTRLRRASLT